MANQKKHSKKHGRNSDFCKAYSASQKHEISHAKRVYRHLMRYGLTNHQAVHHFNNMSPLVRKKAGVPIENLTPEPTAHKRIRPAYRGKAMGGRERRKEAAE